MYDLRRSNELYRQQDYKRKVREKLEGKEDHMINYDNWIVMDEHRRRGWETEDFVECLQCGTYSPKELCSNDCKEAYLTD